MGSSPIGHGLDARGLRGAFPHDAFACSVSVSLYDRSYGRRGLDWGRVCGVVLLFGSQGMVLDGGCGGPFGSPWDCCGVLCGYSLGGGRLLFGASLCGEYGVDQGE